MRRAILAAAVAVLATAAAVGGQPESPGYAVEHGWPQLPHGTVLGSAAGVAVDADDNVWVFHRGNRVWTEPLPLDPIAVPTVIQFDGRTGKVLRQWGAGVFAMPHGLSIGPDGNLWMTDVALHQVFKFSPDGTLLLTLGERGVPGDDGGHFNRPTDVAALADGSFYVSDGYRNTRVAKFAADGRFLFQWGRPGRGPGEFQTPHGIAVDAGGRVYVADRQNDRVQVFDARGTFLAQWRSPDIGRPYGLTLLREAGVAIADGGEQPQSPPDRSGVAVLTRDGALVERFGRFGNQDGQFRMAHDIAADRAGNLYVVDITGQRVQKFRPHALQR